MGRILLLVNADRMQNRSLQNFVLRVRHKSDRAFHIAGDLTAIDKLPTHDFLRARMQ
jgi:hypothetical protein